MAHPVCACKAPDTIAPRLLFLCSTFLFPPLNSYLLHCWNSTRVSLWSWCNLWWMCFFHFPGEGWRGFFFLNVKQVSRAPRQLLYLPRMCLFLNTGDQISAMLVTNPYLCVRGSPPLCSLQMGMPLLVLFTLQLSAFFSNYSNGSRGKRGTGGQDAIWGKVCFESWWMKRNSVWESSLEEGREGEGFIHTGKYSVLYIYFTA